MELDSLSSELEQFEQRKIDHIELALDPRNQSTSVMSLAAIDLIHEALPDLNFEEISLETESLSQGARTPFLVSAMTAGHEAGVQLNGLLAEVCDQRGWSLAVGSQRRELTDSLAGQAWRPLRKKHPRLAIFGNIGLSQLIQIEVSEIERLVENLEANALFVHLNPLQECLQLEGTPQFRGGKRAIERLVTALKVPVIVKETGCGFSKSTLSQLSELGVAAVELSGRGGTHWGRIEGARAEKRDVAKDHLSRASLTFEDWGHGTLESLLNAKAVQPKFEIWASGGLRTGLDAAKCLALGAKRVGFAHAALKEAMNGSEALDRWMSTVEFETRVAMFCCGVSRIQDFSQRQYWQWQKR